VSLIGLGRTVTFEAAVVITGSTLTTRTVSESTPQRVRLRRLLLSPE
jgi:hypothetical protein